MDKVQELISVMAEKKVNAGAVFAKAHHSCKTCEEPANGFRSPRSELEYRISSIYQAC